MNDYFSIGKIVATYGLTGEVVLAHALGKKTDLRGLQTIFIEEKNKSFLPYFIESSKSKNDTEVYLKIEGFESKEGARRLIQKEVWLLKTDFDKFAGSASPISLLGYTMINDGNILGQVTEVIEQPMQVLCKVIINHQEALIPIHDQSLVKIDKRKMQVHVQLPDGLLELYAADG